MKHPAARVALLVVLVVGGFVLAKLTPVGHELHRVARALAAEAHEPWAPFAYVGLYGGALAVGMPGTILTVIGGAAFGTLVGLSVNLAGALAGATLAFVEGRYLARDAVRVLFGHHLARLQNLGRPRAAVWAFFRLRMIPLVPFNGLNFAAGLTEAGLAPYLLGTLLGILPSTAVYTYFAAELAHAGAARQGAAWRVGVALAVFGLVGVAPTLWQLVRRRVQSAHGSRRARRSPLPGAPGPDLPGARGA